MLQICLPQELAHGSNLPFMKTFGDRLKELRVRANLSQRKLAATAGVAERTVIAAEKATEKRGGFATYSFIVEALAKKLGMTTDEVDGYLTGPLPEIRDQIKEIESKPPSPEWQHAVLGPRERELDDIPIVAQAPAGGISQAYEPKVMGTVPRGVFPHDPQAFAVVVNGDSMSPWVNHGDIVIASPAVAFAREGPGIGDGMPCVVQMREPGGEVRDCLKLVLREPDGRYRLQPMNPAYTPTWVLPENLTIVPIVCRILRDWLRTGLKIPVIPGRDQAGPVTFVKPEDVPQKFPDYDGPQLPPDDEKPTPPTKRR